MSSTLRSIIEIGYWDQLRSWLVRCLLTAQSVRAVERMFPGMPLAQRRQWKLHAPWAPWRGQLWAGHNSEWEKFPRIWFLMISNSLGSNKIISYQGLKVSWFLRWFKIFKGGGCGGLWSPGCFAFRIAAGILSLCSRYFQVKLGDHRAKPSQAGPLSESSTPWHSNRMQRVENAKDDKSDTMWHVSRLGMKALLFSWRMRQQTHQVPRTTSIEFLSVHRSSSITRPWSDAKCRRFARNNAVSFQNDQFDDSRFQDVKGAASANPMSRSDPASLAHGTCLGTPSHGARHRWGSETRSERVHRNLRLKFTQIYKVLHASCKQIFIMMMTFGPERPNAIKDPTPSKTSTCLVGGTSRLLQNWTTVSHDFVCLVLPSIKRNHTRKWQDRKVQRNKFEETKHKRQPQCNSPCHRAWPC